jgi:hypothetical protein
VVRSIMLFLCVLTDKAKRRKRKGCSQRNFDFVFFIGGGEPFEMKGEYF